MGTLPSRAEGGLIPQPSDDAVADCVHPREFLAATIRAQRARFSVPAGGPLQLRDELLRHGTGQGVPDIALALLEQVLGDYESAFAWYERAYERRDFFLAVLHTDPAYRLIPPGRSDSITDDFRWIDLVRRVGLAP
jgi:hypothetical protein